MFKYKISTLFKFSRERESCLLEKFWVFSRKCSSVRRHLASLERILELREFRTKTIGLKKVPFSLFWRIVAREREIDSTNLIRMFGSRKVGRKDKKCFKSADSPTMSAYSRKVTKNLHKVTKSLVNSLKLSYRQFASINFPLVFYSLSIRILLEFEYAIFTWALRTIRSTFHLYSPKRPLLRRVC